MPLRLPRHSFEEDGRLCSVSHITSNSINYEVRFDVPSTFTSDPFLFTATSTPFTMAMNTTVLRQRSGIIRIATLLPSLLGLIFLIVDLSLQGTDEMVGFEASIYE